MAVSATSHALGILTKCKIGSIIAVSREQPKYSGLKRVIMKKVQIFTDGACSGNPGAGGWGAVLKYMGHRREMSGYEPDTTNNRMELTAAIMALKALKEPCDVTLTTDSKYLVDGMTKGWARSWKFRGWKKSDGKPALNPDLWEELLELSDIHKITFVWIKGHDGNPENERCDALAVGEYSSRQKGDAR